MREFFFRRDFKRSHRAPLRVQRACHVADRAIFTAGIASLQDDEYALLSRRKRSSCSSTNSSSSRAVFCSASLDFRF
jgi:hypothetical protein